MFLVRAIDELPSDLMIHAFRDGAQNEWEGKKPDQLIPLGQSAWPDEIKQRIAEIFKAVGCPDPLRQKLVEPRARVFGGRRDRVDLSKVNWGLAIDYFTWEAASMTDRKKAEALQKKAKKKYGGIFSHYRVYFTE